MVVEAFFPKGRGFSNGKESLCGKGGPGQTGMAPLGVLEGLLGDEFLCAQPPEVFSPVDRIFLRPFFAPRAFFWTHFF